MTRRQVEIQGGNVMGTATQLVDEWVDRVDEAPYALPRAKRTEVRPSSRASWDIKGKLVNGVGAMHALPDDRRVSLLRACGLQVGSGTTIKSGCTFEGKPRIAIGVDCFIGAQSFIEAAAAEITIGDRVYVAHRVNVITATHYIGDHAMRASLPQRREPVTIGDGCWLGTGSIVLPGVTVGAGCVIAAGAVVTSDCDPDGLYAGVPARRIRDLV
jgi:maltose O-acetyltransferase